MKIILITGSRNINQINWIFEKLDSEIDKSQDIIIHGGAKGVDTIADSWCKKNNIKSIVIRPLSESKREYYLYRNTEMIGMCDKVIAFWDGQSRGTKFTFEYARKRGKETKVFTL
jgi:hypothetical protein